MRTNKVRPEGELESGVQAAVLATLVLTAQPPWTPLTSCFIFLLLVINLLSLMRTFTYLSDSETGFHSVLQL